MRTAMSRHGRLMRLLGACAVVCAWAGLPLGVCGRNVVVNISNVGMRLDVHGAPMDAHDGCIVQWEEAGGLYFWYGMGYGNCTETRGELPPVDCPGIYKPFGACGFSTDHAVNIYTSPDLVHWTFVGDALPASARPKGIYFRPKVVFNRNTHEYVMWINFLPPASTPLQAYPNATYLVARASSPQGPFSVATPRVKIAHAGAGDFALLVDGVDGEGYLAYTSFSSNHRIAIEQLTPTFYDSLGADNSTGFLSPVAQEAPILFSRKGWYYLFYGRTCCFCSPGAGSVVSVAPHPLGPWTNTHVDLNPSRTISPLSAHVIPAQENYVILVGNSTYVYTGDRWGSAPDHLKSHDLQYWQPLQFDDATEPPTNAPLAWVDWFLLDV